MASNASAKVKLKDKVLSLRKKSDNPPSIKEQLKKSNSFSTFISKFKPSVSEKLFQGFSLNFL